MNILVDYLKSNDTFQQWQEKLNAIIANIRSIEAYPDQSGKTGFVLTTDGNEVNWGKIEGLISGKDINVDSIILAGKNLNDRLNEMNNLTLKHASRHAINGGDPITLESLGFVISSAAPPSSTSDNSVRLWIQYI